MEEKKEKPNLKERVSKVEELKFGFLEVLILLFITAIVTIIVTVTVNKLSKEDTAPKIYNTQIQRFVDEYNYILNKYYGNISSEELINNAIAGMVNNLSDPYSSFIDENSATSFDVSLDGEFYGLGVEIKLNENNEIEIYRLLEGHDAITSGLKEGDVILKMDDESSDGLTPEQFRSLMIKNNKETVKLTVRRGEDILEYSVKRTLVEITSVISKTFESGSAKVGYIAISVFANNTYRQFKEALTKLESEKIDSLIVDVRGNYGGSLATVTSIISEFIDSTHVIYQIKDSKGTIKEYSLGTRDLKYPFVVLIDGSSASASELLASALQEQANAKLVGTKSFGKATVQNVVDLQNGSKYKITVKEWLTSKGNTLHGKGLNPDVEVFLDDEYFANPSDETDNQLNEALKILKK